MVVGAGGSIGRELALRLARMGVRRLILLESCESRLAGVKDTLEAMGAPAEYFLGDVGDRSLLEHVFAEHGPDVVLHAAAYKQVPLLEEQPFAALENNVFGTASLLVVARDARVVLLSTDKAVRPVSMLGATKRVAEQMVLAAGGVVARLCNVLESRDNVTELFARQMRADLPLTVTDVEARRYFMTLEEAGNLLLHAAIERGGPALLLPALEQQQRVMDLARFMAERLAPEREVPMRITGLRPGEKREEMLMREEEAQYARRSGSVMRVEQAWEWTRAQQDMLTRLREATLTRNLPDALEALCGLVPEYEPGAGLRRRAEREAEREAGRDAVQVCR